MGLFDLFNRDEKDAKLERRPSESAREGRLELLMDSLVVLDPLFEDVV